MRKKQLMDVFIAHPSSQSVRMLGPA